VEEVVLLEVEQEEEDEEEEEEEEEDLVHTDAMTMNDFADFDTGSKSDASFKFNPIFKEACHQLFWIGNDLRSAQYAMLEASKDSFTSVVSSQTAERIRAVLGTIRHGLAMLSDVADSLGAQKSVCPLVPAVDIGDADSSLVAGLDLNASNAPNFLLDTWKTMKHFEDHVGILSSQFSTLQSAEADNDFSDAPGVLAVGEGVSANDDKEEDVGSAGDFADRFFIQQQQTAPIVPFTAASEKECSSPEIKVISHTPFWTESKDINVASYLSTRFNAKFEERANVKGNLCPTTSHGDDSNLWAKARFFVSSDFVAKVYRILWNPDKPHAKTILPQALHESAATAFVCERQKWHCEVFGVFHQGTNAVYLDICLIRTRLNCAYLTADRVSSECIQLLKSCGIMHGDGHIGNAKFRLGCSDVELVDFERSFPIARNKLDEMVSIIEQYARNPDLHTIYSNPRVGVWVTSHKP
jgi:hypothetical protein